MREPEKDSNDWQEVLQTYEEKEKHHHLNKSIREEIWLDEQK